VGLAAQSIRATMIASQDQAQERGFVGSPTILVDGVDPFGVVGCGPGPLPAESR
jgi:2-hydroxychromene-2-carboxylate isomerase